MKSIAVNGNLLYDKDGFAIKANSREQAKNVARGFLRKQNPVKFSRFKLTVFEQPNYFRVILS